MNILKLSDIDLLDIGNKIAMTGTIWSDDQNQSLIVLFPEFKEEDLGELKILELSVDDWKAFLKQSDIMETEILVNDDGNLKKAIVRKSARIIESKLQWRVFERDDYMCRYCGNTGVPLSVDHIDLWEYNGATVEENLLSACKKCNKIRGNTPYEIWIESPRYLKISSNLSTKVKEANIAIVSQLPHLYSLRMQNLRSR